MEPNSSSVSEDSAESGRLSLIVSSAARQLKRDGTVSTLSGDSQRDVKGQQTLLCLVRRNALICKLVPSQKKMKGHRLLHAWK